MRIAIPKEIKTLEGRVALIPAAAGEIVKQGHEVYVQKDAGVLSGYQDKDYESVGVKILPDAKAIYDSGEMIVKVKEPQATELDMLRRDHLLFSYLHLAAEQSLMSRLLDIGLTAVAFETIEDKAGRLPLLAPMSDIAGRVAVQVGTHLLHRPQGGKGILLGGLPATARGNVVILGAGVAGGCAAVLAAGMGTNVIVFDRNRDKLERMRALGNNVTALHAYPDEIGRAVKDADLLIGAILVTGARAEHLVSESMVSTMQTGSVIIDISVDQGGCIETTRPTTYAQPTYDFAGVTHFGVTNMPGAVPRTASQALSAAITSYVGRLTYADWREQADLAAGINVQAGEIVHPALKTL